MAAVRVALPQVYANHHEGWFTRSSTTATTSTYCGTSSRDALSQRDRLAEWMIESPRLGQLHLGNCVARERGECALLDLISVLPA